MYTLYSGGRALISAIRVGNNSTFSPRIVRYIYIQYIHGAYADESVICSSLRREKHPSLHTYAAHPSSGGSVE